MFKRAPLKRHYNRITDDNAQAVSVQQAMQQPVAQMPIAQPNMHFGRGKIAESVPDNKLLASSGKTKVKKLKNGLDFILEVRIQ